MSTDEKQARKIKLLREIYEELKQLENQEIKSKALEQAR